MADLSKAVRDLEGERNRIHSQLEALVISVVQMPVMPSLR